MNNKKYRVKIVPQDVSRGTIAFYDLENYKKQLDLNVGWEGYIEFVSLGSTKVIDESCLKTYKWWVDIIRSYTQKDFDSQDYYLRKMFTEYTSVRNGKILKVVKQMTDMTFKDFVEYLDCIYLWANEIEKFKDINLPLPKYMKGL